ncbi:MAG: hypothetical protein ABT02_12675 [Comamonadaceae bacterium SCN 68-20]|jgi:hypothetical protein|nr:hypothetical protein [Comamonadaceae bacterium]ODU59009.1 MAG: hypothetical protein ABT02_12675 [Comamonadaceae bacterium SCN 68-20]OJX27900.1 MAG: hypothetical protein BGO75_00640 [Burkholderiales bacterium 68-20]
MTRSLWLIFRWPLLIAMVSIVGLVSALVGDGMWDALSWATLGIPAVGFSAWCLRPFMQDGRRERQ